jgi:hypothetical protein
MSRFIKNFCALAVVAVAILATVNTVDAANAPAADQANPTARILDYLYFTNFETIDPELHAEPAGCAGKYYSEWVGRYECLPIEFAQGDSVEGPMHTNDAARVEGAASFGRKNAVPPDVIEIYGGTYPEDSGERCSGKPIFHTVSGCYIKGEMIAMPDSASGLEPFVEPNNELAGETRLELNGAANTIAVVTFNSRGERAVRTLGWPQNGLIYVKSQSCGWPTAGSSEAFNTDGPAEAKSEKGCGNVYVRGTYSRPLTIAAQDDLIIDGNIYPTSIAGKLGAAPSGSATLGLIAGKSVRIYHPVSTTGVDALDQCSDKNLSQAEDPNGWGSQLNIWVYAAILATDDAFMVDNFACGAPLGEIHLYGAIAQDYRGVIGTASGSGGESGYTKDYKYDDRLTVDQPPFFVARRKAECQLSESAIALVGARGVRRAPFTVTIGSPGIEEITFYLDGRAFRTLTAAQAKGGQYAVRVNPRKLSYGAHTLSVKTVMEDAACAPAVRRSVFVYPHPPDLAPRFTG